MTTTAKRTPGRNWAPGAPIEKTGLSVGRLAMLKQFAIDALPKEGEVLEQETYWEKGRHGTDRKAQWRNSFRKGGGVEVAGQYEWLVWYTPRSQRLESAKRPGKRFQGDMDLMLQLVHDRQEGRLTTREYALGVWLVALKMSRYRSWFKKMPVWLPEFRFEDVLR
jgi:hypothetical protein